MRKMTRVITILILSMTLCVSVSMANETYRKMPWKTLSELNYDGEVPSESLKQKIAGTVRIWGYAMPLKPGPTDDTVSEFFLLPTQMECIHVPPPPPNQMVLVRLKKAVSLEIIFDEIWTYGVLQTEKSDYFGTSAWSYTMSGDRVVIAR